MVVVIKMAYNGAGIAEGRDLKVEGFNVRQTCEGKDLEV